MAHRVSVGGHGIPEEDIEKRYVETFENLKEVLPMCDLVALYDNTEEVAFRRVAIYKNGEAIRVSSRVLSGIREILISFHLILNCVFKQGQRN